MSMKLGAGLTLSFLLSCSSGILFVQDIESGMNLESAENVSAEFFFSKRMENRIKKVDFGYWKILKESEDTVFFGYPILHSIFSDRLKVEKLYKTSKVKLSSVFPGYQTITAIEIRSLLVQNFLSGKNKKITCTRLHQEDWKPILQDKSILVQINCFPRANANESFQVHATVDKTSGTLIQFQRK